MADNEEIKRQSWRQIPFVSAMSVRKEKKEEKPSSEKVCHPPLVIG